jgi:hypothetical protein
MPPVISQGTPNNGLTTYSVKGYPELIVRAKSWLAAERELRVMFEAVKDKIVPLDD